MNTSIALLPNKDLIMTLRIPQEILNKYPQECNILNATIVFNLEGFNKRLMFLEEAGKLEVRSLDVREETGSDVRT